jgi:hypothetical protein
LEQVAMRGHRFHYRNFFADYIRQQPRLKLKQIKSFMRGCTSSWD